MTNASAGEAERRNGNGYSGVAAEAGAETGAGAAGGGAAAAADHARDAGSSSPSHRGNEHFRQNAAGTGTGSASQLQAAGRAGSVRSQISGTSNTSVDEYGVPKRKKSISKSYVKQVTRANSNRSKGSRQSQTANESPDAPSPAEATTRGLTLSTMDNGTINERSSQEGSDENFALKDKPVKKEIKRTPSNLVPFTPQAAGHEEALKSWDDHPGMILKKSSDQEHQALEKLMSTTLKKFVPAYHGRETIDEEQFLVMQNCLFELERPHVMDIKMGQRTFQETEVSNEKRRKDLLEKMNKVDPKEASAEEQEQGITKLRYMQFREKMSTSLTLGFRVDAIHLPDDGPGTLTRDGARKLSSKAQVEKALAGFLGNHRSVWTAILERLKELRSALEESAWFRGHELVGSSLLFAFDDENPSTTAGVWMIDFAHANPVSSPLSHREEWQPGNHEDGYLTGLDCLISMWEESLYPGGKVDDVVVEGAK